MFFSDLRCLAFVFFTHEKNAFCMKCLITKNEKIMGQQKKSFVGLVLLQQNKINSQKLSRLTGGYLILSSQMYGDGKRLKLFVTSFQSDFYCWKMRKKCVKVKNDSAFTSTSTKCQSIVMIRDEIYINFKTKFVKILLSLEANHLKLNST